MKDVSLVLPSTPPWITILYLKSMKSNNYYLGNILFKTDGPKEKRGTSIKGTQEENKIVKDDIGTLWGF